ncbi:MAG: alpha/beta fold hydrolase [Bacteroidales bacterium]
MKLHYHHFGQGQPLIILHGLFGLSDNWVTIGKRLAANYHVFIPDQRNHGMSPHDRTFNYYALADDLLDFMEEHELENIVLLGHSMGGKVAMNFALDYPEKVDRLVIVDMGVREYKARAIHYHLIEAMESVDFDTLTSRQEIEEQLKQYIPQKPLRLFIMKNLKRFSQNQLGWKLNLPVLKANLDTVVEGVNRNDRFNRPALFIGGGKSDYIEPHDVKAIKEIFPKAEVEIIQDASHWVHADTPEAFCKIVSSFLHKSCKSMEDLIQENRNS